MKEYEITTTSKITDEDIDDMLTTAFEGGINYWCDEVRIRQVPSEEYKYLSDVLTREGTLELSADGEWHTLKLDNLLKALGEMNFNFDDYDAGDADTAVQKAVFGEVVYG